jgi:hypothetical protein
MIIYTVVGVVSYEGYDIIKSFINRDDANQFILDCNSVDKQKGYFNGYAIEEHELEAYKDFQVVSAMDSKSSLIEIKPDAMYLMTIDPRADNIDDCLSFCEQAKEVVNTYIRIIRIKEDV